jgi:hypothetical protein
LSLVSLSAALVGKFVYPYASNTHLLTTF